jgi:hypothetical protein
MAGAPPNRHIDVPPRKAKGYQPLKDITDPPIAHYHETGRESGSAPAEYKPNVNERKHLNNG